MKAKVKTNQSIKCVDQKEHAKKINIMVGLIMKHGMFLCGLITMKDCMTLQKIAKIMQNLLHLLKI
jgi:hypothetical protein